MVSHFREELVETASLLRSREEMPQTEPPARAAIRVVPEALVEQEGEGRDLAVPAS
jgi:hypothetical protein